MKILFSDILVLLCVVITITVCIKLINERNNHRKEVLAAYTECRTQEHSVEHVNIRLRWKK